MKTLVRAGWTRTVLVCRKCSRKLDGGFGPDGDRSLTKALRRHLDVGKGRRATVGIVEIGCLKICPKRAVVVVDAERPGQWLLVAEGTAMDVITDRLALSCPGQDVAPV